MRYTALLSSFLLAMGPLAAGAATVTVLGQGYAPAPLQAPDATTGSVNVGLVGNVPGVGLDAWRGSSYAGGSPYISVNGGSSATYAFDTAMTEILFRWGSPDRFNGIEFLLGDEVIDSVTGRGEIGEMSEYPAYSTDDYYVSVTTEAAFDAVRYTSRLNSFEFAQIQPAPVPLPATGGLLVAGLAAFGAWRRRR